MDSYNLIHLISICAVNGFFALAGIFLNSVVIISLWKSSQLRRKTCYFMILVLSCFDLGVVIFGHAEAIMLSIDCFLDGNTSRKSDIVEFFSHMYTVSQALAFGALLTMNIDRYLAIVYPFFYQSTVTKDKLLKLLVLIELLIHVFPIMTFIRNLHDVGYIGITFELTTMVLLMIFMNCRMFVIAKNKSQVTPAGVRIRGSARNSTCLFVIACFCVCATPLIVYNTLMVSSSRHTRLNFAALHP